MLQSLIISAFVLSFLTAAFDTVFVLFAYTPIEVGGLAFSVRAGSSKGSGRSSYHDLLEGFPDWLLSIHRWLPRMLGPTVCHPHPSPEV